MRVAPICENLSNGDLMEEAVTLTMRIGLLSGVWCEVEHGLDIKWLP